MGWDTDLQDASFRGVQFDCTTTQDAVSKALAIKQAPYSNEAVIEDMGNDPRRISLNAVYTGADYKTQLDALEAALLATGAGELIHPIYGINRAQVASYSIGHSVDDGESCNINIEFLLAKDQARELFIPIVNSTPATTTQSIIAAPAASLATELDQTQLQDPNAFFEVATNIRNNLQAARQVLGVVKGAIENVLAPADWVVGVVDDIAALVTFDTNITAIAKWRDVFYRVQRFASLFQNDSIATRRNWRATTVASSVAVTTAVLDKVRSDMAQGLTPDVTPNDLAVMRAQTRKVIQAAIRAERGENINTADQVAVYKQVADQVHLQIQALIEQRPPLSTAQISVPCTLHWLAHVRYGDYSRAAEIRRLNASLSTPCLVAGMQVVAYAQ